MTTNIQEWLPDDALVDDRFKPVIDELLSRWGERWIASGNGCQLASVKRGASIETISVADSEWRQSGSGLACRWNDSLAMALALAIVDSKDRQSPLSSSDKTLLAELAWEALSDLMLMVAKALRFDGTSPSDVHSTSEYVVWQVRHRDKRFPDLAWRTSLSSFVAARKAMIGTSFPAVETSGPLSRACADLQLPVAAALGSARISWGELQNLEPGDVLVLDQAVADSFPLLSNRSGTELCRLSLLNANDQLTLVVA